MNTSGRHAHSADAPVRECRAPQDVFPDLLPDRHPFPTVRLHIPAIRVTARVAPVGLDRRKRIVPPASASLVGWWRGGVRPGRAGPAVLVGHLDTAEGPAVFAGLSELRRGNTVTVARSGGRDVTFRVRAVREYPQDDFPDAKVYGPADHVQLRLITCAGSFDQQSGHYRNNTVVFAEREKDRQ